MVVCVATPDVKTIKANVVKEEIAVRTLTYQPQQAPTQNRCFKCFVVSSLTAIIILLVYIVMTLRIERSWQPKCNCSEINNFGFDLAQDEQLQVNILSLSAEDTQMDYSDIAPVIFKVSNFNEKVNKTKRWISDPFFAFERGYKMILAIDAAGSLDGRGTHLSVYLYAMQGPYDDELEKSGKWPLQGTFIIELLDQHYNFEHYKDYVLFHNETCSECAKRPINITNRGYGISRFALLSDLIGNSQYHKNDQLFFRISYRSCHSCVLMARDGEMLLFLIVLFTLDYFFIFVLLLCADMCNHEQHMDHARRLKDMGKMLYISMSYMVNGFKPLLLIAIIKFSVILPYILWEFAEFFALDSAYDFEPALFRSFVLAMYSNIVFTFPHVNREYIVVKPIWLLAALSQTSKIRPAFEIIIVVFGNIFFIIIQSLYL